MIISFMLDKVNTSSLVVLLRVCVTGLPVCPFLVSRQKVLCSHKRLTKFGPNVIGMFQWWSPTKIVSTVPVVSIMSKK